MRTDLNEGNNKPWPILVGGDSVEDIFGELKEVFSVRVDVPCRHLGWVYLHGEGISTGSTFVATKSP